jgi:hypothetical protein
MPLYSFIGRLGEATLRQRMSPMEEGLFWVSKLMHCRGLQQCITFSLCVAILDRFAAQSVVSKPFCINR